MKRITLHCFWMLMACACICTLAAQQPSSNHSAEAEEPSAATGSGHKKQQDQRSNEPARDMVIMGGNLVVAEGQRVADGVLIGGTATVDGKVNGDLVVIFGTAKVGPSAEVSGDLVVVGGVADVDPGAKIKGDRVILGLNSNANLPGYMRWPGDWISKGLLWGRPLPHQVLWSWIIAGIFFAFYVLAAVLFPRSVQASMDVLSLRPGGAFLSGLLALLLFGPLLGLLFITFVGWILIPFLICAFFTAFLFGRVVVYRYAGQQFGTQTGVELLQKPIVALVLGILIFYLLYTIPVLGLLAWCAVTPLGLGAVLLAFFQRVRSETSKAAPSEPIPVISVPPIQAGVGAPPMPEPQVPLTLPRVGFWLRLAATLIDLVLVGVLTRLLHLHGAAFIFLWTAYHVGMWTWKGTTIGGIVFGLKLVRVNGTPIDFSVALVRALASFLSAAALFIGFFWAGWSADKQSWHDKIAGTCIVRMPKGMSML